LLAERELVDEYEQQDQSDDRAPPSGRGAVRAIAALDPIIERCTGLPGRAGMLPDPDATVVR